MTTKRRLNRIRLDKIAAVGSPCQEHAIVAIIKRAPGNTPPAIAKATFAEALAAQLIGEKISDTFWRAFENQWAIRDAFRTALTDEIAAGGDGTEAAEGFVTAMRDIATLAAEAARNAASTAEPDLESAVEEAVSKWLQTKELPMPKITTKAALKTAAAAFSIAKSTVGEMNEIVDAAVELDAIDDLPAAQTELVAAAKAKAKKPDEKDGDETKTLKRQVAVLSLAPVSKSYFDKLDTAAQDAFLAKSEADQAEEIAKAQGDNPVVYKCADGLEIRKSDGAAVLALAKKNDEQAAEIVKLRAKGEGDAIEKRAVTDFPNVAKATAVSMLKSAATLGEDTDAGKDLLKSLKAMNDGRQSLFKSHGSTEAPTGGESIEKARTDFNSAVAKIAARDKIGVADAMSKARVEEPNLFAEAYPDTADQDPE